MKILLKKHPKRKFYYLIQMMKVMKSWRCNKKKKKMKKLSIIHTKKRMIPLKCEIIEFISLMICITIHQDFG